MSDQNQSDDQLQSPEGGYTPPASKHKFLLFLVIFMGILFFVGFAGLIYAVINEVNKSETTEQVSEQRVSVKETASFGDLNINKPADSNLVDYTSDGTYLTLRFKKEDGREELVIISLATGQEKGRLKLTDQ